MNEETGLPGALDVLLRDLHLLWCREGCPPDWHLGDADPERAAFLLASALWGLGKAAGRGDPDAGAALATLTWYVEAYSPY